MNKNTKISQVLESVDLSGSLPSGSIPTNPGQLQHLSMFNLSHNSLSGTIAPTFSITLDSVDISNNQLEGPLPNNLPFLDAPLESLKNNKGLCELAQTTVVNDLLFGVYSFGVLALEIIIGKHPGDLISQFWPQSLIPIANDLLLVDILDERPSQPTKPINVEVIMIARLALACSNKNPRSRPTMDQVYKAFVTVKSPLPEQFSMIRLGQLH
ncbi:hypothetical protein RJT34_18180 [Clitoria ternatea]|uniref:non-specific serine/threonine protein kinase n=1 Tax=Clitoria ternatea TaxID=43366 RepID=A0AAN9JBJ7_CLITE